MTLRTYLERLDQTGDLRRIRKPVSKPLTAAGLLKALEPQLVFCERVTESAFPVMGHLFCRKASLAGYLGIPVREINPTLTRAIDQRQPPEITPEAPWSSPIPT